MAEISRPWNGTTVGDAGPYTDQQWHELYRYIIGLGGNRNNVGIFLGSGTQPSDGLRVLEQSPAAAAVNVLPGSALVNGIAYMSDATEAVLIAANASGNPRIDTVVLQADYALQECRLTILQGTPAATPVPPSLTQVDGTLWEIPVADIEVANGFVTIAQANIIPRHEWVNAPPGVYLDHVANNSGADLQDGDVVVWDNTGFQLVTTTTTLDDKSVAGVWRGRTANGLYGRVQTKGLGFVRTNAAVTVGDLLVSSTTVKQAVSTTGAINKSIGRVLETTSGAGLALCNIDVHTVRYEDYILIRDEKSSGVAAASIVNGAWRQRELNTEVFDTGGHASVGSNEITLLAGTYECIASTPVSSAVINRCRLQNITDGTTTLEGQSSLSGPSMLTGFFTITGTKVFQLQQWTSTTSNGGTALSTGANEKYATVYLVRKGQTP